MPTVAAFKLMQGVVYAAGLGTALVLVVLRLISQPLPTTLADVRTWYAVFLLAYFGQSYLANERRARAYGWGLFFCDIGEVVLILTIFKFLGFVEVSRPDSNLRWFYVAFCGVPVLRLFWNLQVSRHIGPINWRLPTINGTRMAILIAAAALAPTSIPIAWLVLAGQVLLTAWYVVYKRRRGELDICEARGVPWR